jgi:hypothetical protein
MRREYLIITAMAAALMSLSAGALAADLDSVDLLTPILTADGKPMEECLDPPKCETKRPLTLGLVAMEALNSDGEVKGDMKAKAGALAIKVAMAKKMSLTLDDARLIKDVVNRSAFSSVVVARVNAILDPAAK